METKIPQEFKFEGSLIRAKPPITVNGSDYHYAFGPMPKEVDGSRHLPLEAINVPNNEDFITIEALNVLLEERKYIAGYLIGISGHSSCIFEFIVPGKPAPVKGALDGDPDLVQRLKRTLQVPQLDVIPNQGKCSIQEELSEQNEVIVQEIF